MENGARRVNARDEGGPPSIAVIGGGWAGCAAAVHLAKAGARPVLYEQASKWFLTASDKAVKAGEGTLGLDDMEAHVDPRAEWQAMFHEVWRIERVRRV